MQRQISANASVVQRLVPLVASLRGYDRGSLRGDLTAGVTTAVMLVPQAMAYAMLAGLPPIIGLYASLLPLVVYALLGTSRQLAVGPVAMVSLMVAAGVGSVAEPGSAQYIGYAVLLAAMVGLLQLVMGLARLGFLVNFLSHPVVSGFTSAAALIIGFSQLKHLLGLDIPRSHHVHATLLSAASQLGQVHGLTLALGVAAVVLMLLLRRFRPGVPAALVVVVASTLLVSALGLDQRGVAIVGTVPSGLPRPALPPLSWSAVQQLWPTALAIGLVGFMESISVAKAFARRGRYEVDASKELGALGLANLVGSLFQAYPVTGGFSRTAVNAQAGARTGLASLVTAAIIAITVALFTPLFYYLPKAVLAAIIMVAVFGLVDLGEVRHLWRVKRSDLALLLLTFAATLTLGIEQGILAGVGASLVLVLVRATRPRASLLGQVPGTHAFRSLEHHPEARTVPGVLVLRIDAQFFFGNVSFLKQTINRLRGDHRGPLRAIVLDAGSINQLDSSADTALHEVAQDLAEEGVALLLAEVRGPVRAVMQRSGLVEQLGRDRFFLTVRGAVEHARRLAAAHDTPVENRRASAVVSPAEETTEHTRAPAVLGVTLRQGG